MAKPTFLDWDAFRCAMVEARRCSGLSKTAFARQVGWRGNPELVRAFEAGEIYPTVEVAVAMVKVLRAHLPAAGAGRSCRSRSGPGGGVSGPGRTRA